jgi:hypothetical protein
MSAQLFVCVILGATLVVLTILTAFAVILPAPEEEVDEELRTWTGPERRAK